MDWCIGFSIVPKNSRLGEGADVHRTILIAGPETVELGPVGFQPDPRLLHGRNGVLYEAPKARPMVHLAQMRDLMSCDVIQNKWRRKDEPP